MTPKVGHTLQSCLPVQGGTIDMIASDHSPATPALKLLDEGDFLSAWGGIAGGVSNVSCRSHHVFSVPRLLD